jgi:hypothetical protein
MSFLIGGRAGSCCQFVCCHQADTEQAERLTKVETKLTTVEDTLAKMEETSEDNSKKLDSILALLAQINPVFICLPYILLRSAALKPSHSRQDLHIRKAFGPGLPVHPARLPQSQPQTHCL